MSFEEDLGERFISHPTDAWSDGVASDNGGIVTLKPAYDGTEGSQTYEGWARYIDPVAEADIFKELPGEVPNALDLHSRFGSKGMPSFAGARESGIVHRKLKVSWCCTTGVSKESRQTKVDEALPARYGQDQ